MPPDRRRAAAAAETAADERVSLASNKANGSSGMRHLVGSSDVTLSCPLACSPSCSFRCPVALVDVVPVVVAALR